MNGVERGSRFVGDLQGYIFGFDIGSVRESQRLGQHCQI